MIFKFKKDDTNDENRNYRLIFFNYKKTMKPNQG